MAKKKNNIFLRVFSVLAVLCFLTAGGVLLLKKTAYGEKNIPTSPVYKFYVNFEDIRKHQKGTVHLQRRIGQSP